MKVTLDWLREFVGLPTNDPEAIALALESLGLAVESIEPIHYRFSDVVVGKVIEVKPHPNADKVRLTKVDIGSEVLEIVCGAWNFEEGAIVPVAVPGAVIQGDFTITERDIRGVTSHGMICSEQELELGEDADGIMVLDGDYPDAAGRLGDSFESLLPVDDVVFDIDLTPNRPDWMSVYGIARELAAYYDVPLRRPDFPLDAKNDPAGTSVTILDDEACPRFVGREVDNIVVGPSPHWMRARLEAAGVRPINNVVDASNYAMIEFGHPTHAFDRDRIGDTIVVRRAEEGESIKTLDDVDRTLEPGDIVVGDTERPVAVAGVMGGADTEVSGDTKRALIEAAYWDPPSILLTGRRLDLRSEASARFERGMDPEACRHAADRVAQLLEKYAGATVGGVVDEYPAPPMPVVIELAMAEIERVLGIGIESINPIAAMMDKPKGQPGEADWLEVHDAALLLESAHRYRPRGEHRDPLPFMYPLIATYLLTGGRRKEVLGLEVGDISGSLLGVGLIDPMKAVVHLVVRNHGQAKDLTATDELEAAISSVGGGCDTNQCGDSQFAIFEAP